MNRHPDYEKITNRASFLLLSYKGGLEYIDSPHLFRYVTEGARKYLARKERAVLFNYFRPIVDSFTNGIFQKKIVRQTKTEQLVRFINNATTDGKPLDKIMKRVSKLSTFLNIGVLVDAPLTDRDTITRQEKEANRLYPFVKIILPSRIINWNFDDYGLQFVVIDESYFDNSNFKEKPKKIERYKIWTRDYWQIAVVDENRNVKYEKEVPHSIGYVPVKFVSQYDIDDDKNWESVVEDIALLQRQIYNHASAIDENIHSTCHSLLAVAMGRNYDRIKTSIESPNEGINIIPYEPEGAPPSMIRSDLVNIPAILSVCENNRKEIYRMLGQYLNEQDFFKQSGVAKEIDLRDTEAILKDKADTLEEVENWILQTVALFEGVQFDDKQKTLYPSQFNSEDVLTRLKRDLDIASLNLSDTLNNHIYKVLVRDMYSKLDHDELGKIEKEIENRIQTGGMPGNINFDTTQQPSNREKENDE